MALELWGRVQNRIGGVINRPSRFKAIVVAELVLLLLFAVALTIAPRITLQWIADAASGARDYSEDYRPAIAFLGLLLIAVTSMGLLAVMRSRLPFSQATPGAEDSGDSGKPDVNRKRREGKGDKQSTT